MFPRRSCATKNTFVAPFLRKKRQKKRETRPGTRARNQKEPRNDDGTECQKSRETNPGILPGTRWWWNRMPKEQGDKPRNSTRNQMMMEQNAKRAGRQTQEFYPEPDDDGTEFQKSRETNPGILPGTRWWWNRMPKEQGDKPRNSTRNQMMMEQNAKRAGRQTQEFYPEPDDDGTECQKSRETNPGILPGTRWWWNRMPKEQGDKPRNSTRNQMMMEQNAKRAGRQTQEFYPEPDDDGTECQKSRETSPVTLPGTKRAGRQTQEFYPEPDDDGTECQKSRETNPGILPGTRWWWNRMPKEQGDKPRNSTRNQMMMEQNAKRAGRQTQEFYPEPDDDGTECQKSRETNPGILPGTRWWWNRMPKEQGDKPRNSTRNQMMMEQNAKRAGRHRNSTRNQMMMEQNAKRAGRQTQEFYPEPDDDGTECQKSRETNPGILPGTRWWWNRMPKEQGDKPRNSTRNQMMMEQNAKRAGRQTQEFYPEPDDDGTECQKSRETNPGILPGTRWWWNRMPKEQGDKPRNSTRNQMMMEQNAKRAGRQTQEFYPEPDDDGTECQKSRATNPGILPGTRWWWNRMPKEQGDKPRNSTRNQMMMEQNAKRAGRQTQEFYPEPNDDGTECQKSREANPGILPGTRWWWNRMPKEQGDKPRNSTRNQMMMEQNAKRVGRQAR